MRPGIEFTSSQRQHWVLNPLSHNGNSAASSFYSISSNSFTKPTKYPVPSRSKLQCLSQFGSPLVSILWLQTTATSINKLKRKVLEGQNGSSQKPTDYKWSPGNTRNDMSGIHTTLSLHILSVSFFFFFFFFFLFLGLHSWHTEVPRLVVKSHLQASLHHSHINARSELCLRPTPQLMALPDS